MSPIASELGTKITRLRRVPTEEDSDSQFQALIDQLQDYLQENKEVITNPSERDTPESQDPESLIGEIVGIIESYREDGGIRIFDSDLRALPEIIYYGDVSEIEDEVEIEDLKQDAETSAAYSSLLEYAGLGPEEMNDLSSGEIRDRRQRAGENFSDLFNKYWSQSEIDIKLELSGGRVSLQFYDESDARKDPSARSKGLRRFVSFLAQVIAQSDSKLENSVILLDSPGVHLHPEGQRDLRESLERLSESSQIVFATHAPYMIDTDNLTRIRVTERLRGGGGTKVSDLSSPDTSSDDSLASVRASLGATFSDSLFSSSKTLLVEGYVDRLYLNTMSTIFSHTGDGPSFDINRK